MFVQLCHLGRQRKKKLTGESRIIWRAGLCAGGGLFFFFFIYSCFFFVVLYFNPSFLIHIGMFRKGKDKDKKDKDKDEDEGIRLLVCFTCLICE